MLATAVLLMALHVAQQKATVPPDPGPGPQTQAVLGGPATCRFAPPADLPAGKPEWIGPCIDGKANGYGVVRVPDSNGGAQIFYGLVKAGIPIEGLIGSSAGGGYTVIPGFDSELHMNKTLPAEMQQDARYWKEAATAARTAATHYRSRGNTASFKFYQAQAKVLDRGPGE